MLLFILLCTKAYARGVVYCINWCKRKFYEQLNKLKCSPMVYIASISNVGHNAQLRGQITYNTKRRLYITLANEHKYYLKVCQEEVKNQFNCHQVKVAWKLNSNMKLKALSSRRGELEQSTFLFNINNRLIGIVHLVV